MSNIQVKNIDLFPTRISTAYLNQLSPYFESWRNIILDMRNSEIKPRGKSNRRGWNSPDVLASHKEFKPLMEVVGQLMINVLKTMTEKHSDRKLTAWANIHDEGGFNTQHNHPGCLLSGCFYLSVPEGSGQLVLIDPRPAVNISVLDGTGPNCRRVHRVNPEEGLLIVFPNWLEHSVEPHENELPRISIAMNML